MYYYKLREGLAKNMVPLTQVTRKFNETGGEVGSDQSEMNISPKDDKGGISEKGEGEPEKCRYFIDRRNSICKGCVAQQMLLSKNQKGNANVTEVYSERHSDVS